MALIWDKSCELAFLGRNRALVIFKHLKRVFCFNCKGNYLISGISARWWTLYFYTFFVLTEVVQFSYGQRQKIWNFAWISFYSNPGGSHFFLSCSGTFEIPMEFKKQRRQWYKYSDWAADGQYKTLGFHSNYKIWILKHLHLLTSSFTIYSYHNIYTNLLASINKKIIQVKIYRKFG